MALTGRFLADFSQFQTAVKTAEVTLRSFQSESNKVGSALSKMTDSFSGRKVIQDATLMTEAVDRIGGISKLTATELARLGPVAQEAVAKMKALGMEIPPGLQKIAKETQNVTGLLRGATSVLGAFGIGLSAAAAVGFAKSILSDADALVKMHDKTGISIQGLQKFQVVGDDAGNTVEQMSAAINKFQDNLAGNNASAVAALGKLNIGLADLRAMTPEQQFMAMSDAIRAIKDPAEQVNVAMDLFGRSGAEILPSLKRGFDDVRDAAVGMSDETVRALDEAGDAFDMFVRQAKGWAGTAAVALAKGFEEGNDKMKTFEELAAEVAAQLPKMSAAIKPLTGDTAAFAGALGMTEVELRNVYRSLERDQEALKKNAAEAKRAAADRAALAEKLRELEAVLPGLRQSLGALDSTELTAIGTHLKHVAALDDLAAALRRVEHGNDRMSFDLTKLGEHVDVVGPKVNELDSGLGELAQAFAQLAQISGESFGGAAQGIGKMIGAINLAQKAMKAMTDAVAVGKTAWMQYLAGGLSAFSAIGIGLQVLNDATTAGQKAQDALGQKINALIDAFYGPFQDALSRSQGGLHLLDEAAADAGISLDRFHAALNMPTSQKKWLELSAAINEVNAKLAEYDRLAGMARAQFGPSSADLNKAARDAAAVLQFMQESTLFTQDQLNAAYLAWQQAMADAGDEAAKAWLAAQAAATSGSSVVQAALNALQTKRDSLAKSIENEAPEEVMGVIESQIRGEILALEAQMAEQQRQLERDAREAADTLEDELASINPRGIHVPIIWDIPDLPGGTTSPTQAPTLGPSALRPSVGPSMLSPAVGRFGLSRSDGSGLMGANTLAGLRDELRAGREETARLRSYMTTQFKRDVARAVVDAKATA